MAYYDDKIITIDEAVGKVKSGDYIVSGLGACEARLFLQNLHKAAGRVSNVTITNCLPMTGGEYLNHESFLVESWFYNADYRKAHKDGRISYIPNHLHLAGFKRKQAHKTSILAACACMPDDDGTVCLGLSNVYEKQLIDDADMVILEINPNMPHTYGDIRVNMADVDYVVMADYPLPELPDAPSDDKDRKIGKFIADNINDGDCVQVGIGGIPNAVCGYLFEKKRLGIHTEMMTTGIMRLMKEGVVTNLNKQQDVGKSVCCFCLGTRELYDYMDYNESVVVADGKNVNDPYIIGLNDNQVSINTCIEIDLTGQCSSEGIGHVHFSGSGGQADTAIGAQNSKNGRSFIALYSTAMVKNKETGERTETSKIVPVLKPGAGVTLSRNDVDFVVTEYGVAALRGKSIKEKVYALIDIAHPDFREGLLAEARKYEYIH